MRGVGVDELGHVPFVRHQLDPALVRGAWRAGDAAVVLAERRVVGGTTVAATGFGGSDLPTLLAAVADEVDVPDRVMVTGPAEAVPARWPLAEVRRWHWMLTTREPSPPSVEVVEVEDPVEVSALLDLVAPDSHARPGTPGIEAWLGVRDAGTGHVRAVAVAPSHRGRGLGRELSRALTRAAMGGSGVCSLGVYVDNEPALRTYRGLGYEVVHTFTSGPVTTRSSTTAVAPSR